MTYPETIQYLESFINYEKIPAYPYKESLKLERVRDFLSTIGSPQNALRCIHIAGTKGKGSSCAFITYILREAGYKVGLYTSPHLSDFRERIRILNPKSLPRRQAGEIRNPRQDFEGMIAQDELMDLAERLKPAIEKYNQILKFGPLSFFEVYTALAFVYFKEKKVDFAVLETGLGGRLDATNTVNPLVCAITPISYEHTQKLGHTLRDIAQEKAGIIKGHQSIVISAPQEKEAMEVIRSRCNEFDAKLYEVNKDIFYEKLNIGFNLIGLFTEFPYLKINLLGQHQLTNAAVAVGVIEALRFYNIIVDLDSIRRGLYNTVWPGRCEVVFKNPLVVLDGAQNIASAKALKEAIKENFTRLPDGQGSAKGGKYKKLILVLGISCDKDIKGICHELYDLADEVILTSALNPRATKPKSLAEYFKGKPTQITDNVKEAIELMRKKASHKDLVLITGSLFVVGETRELLFSKKGG